MLLGYMDDGEFIESIHQFFSDIIILLFYKGFLA